MHFLCLFLSSISPPDQGSVDINSGPFDCKIRTTGEIAHYVRCISYNLTPRTFWTSPDAFLATRTGTVNDHAILMASLFLGCSFETFDDLKQQFKALFKKEKKAAKKFQSSKEEDDPGLAKDLKEYEQKLMDMIKNDKFTVVDEDPKEAESSPNDNSDEDEEEDGSDEEEEKETGAVADNPDDNTPFSHRVFLCVGTYGDNKEQCVWVMTYDSNCKDVKFWDPRWHKEYHLLNRVGKPTLLKKFLAYKPKKKGDELEKGDQDQNEEEDKEEEKDGLINEDNEFDYDDKILKETGIKLVMQSDVIAPHDAKKKVEDAGEQKMENVNLEDLKPKKRNKKAEARVIPINRFFPDEKPQF